MSFFLVGNKIFHQFRLSIIPSSVIIPDWIPVEDQARWNESWRTRREASRGRDRELCLRHHVGATVLAFKVGKGEGWRKGGKFVGLPRRWIVNGRNPSLRFPSSSFSEFPFPPPCRFSFLLHIPSRGSFTNCQRHVSVAGRMVEERS